MEVFQPNWDRLHKVSKMCRIGFLYLYIASLICYEIFQDGLHQSKTDFLLKHGSGVKFVSDTAKQTQLLSWHCHLIIHVLKICVQLCSPTTLLVLIRLISNKRSLATYVSQLSSKKTSRIYLQNLTFNIILIAKTFFRPTDINYKVKLGL